MGLLKLEKSAEDVNVMGRELELLQPKLDASTQEVMDLLRVCFILLLFHVQTGKWLMIINK